MNAYAHLQYRIAANYVERRCVEVSENRGPCVDEIKQIYGDKVPLAEAWCAQFVYAVHLLTCMRLGLIVLVPKTKGARDMLNKSRSIFRVDGEPEVGDVFYRYSSAGTGHVGIVIGVGKAGITTIEGNMNDRVGIRTYTWSEIRDQRKGFAFIHVAEKYPTAYRYLIRSEWY
ncbi:MAG TPA: CHAP domain-containing protein [Chlorobiota bacterium]|nr:CHAP domain-containing protein [Chlorobiota bacterium]